MRNPESVLVRYHCPHCLALRTAYYNQEAIVGCGKCGQDVRLLWPPDDEGMTTGAVV